MLDAGIDVTVYSNHSLRKAFTSKANNIGLAISDIQKAAGWKSKDCVKERRVAFSVPKHIVWFY